MMSSAELTLTLEPAADSPRPLALTPGEDLRGYIASYLGRSVLFLLTFTSVLAVAMILLFVIVRSLSFLSGYSLVEFLTDLNWRPTADSPIFGSLAIVVGSLYVSFAVLTLPVMIRASEEAIRAVPQSYKEGALALGSSRFHTFVTITLPAALPGILTAPHNQYGMVVTLVALILILNAMAVVLRSRVVKKLRGQ